MRRFPNIFEVFKVMRIIIISYSWFTILYCIVYTVIVIPYRYKKFLVEPGKKLTFLHRFFFHQFCFLTPIFCFFFHQFFLHQFFQKICFFFKFDINLIKKPNNFGVKEVKFSEKKLV